MDENNTTAELLDPSLPGAWIAEHNRIGQISLLKAKELAQFCSDRGLSDCREKDTIQLWQLGLLKADLIESDEEVTYDGLVARGHDRYGRYRYSDERQLHQRPEGWGEAVKTLPPLDENVKLLFHPFRYYVLYHLSRVLSGAGISNLQVFDQGSYPRLLEWALSSFNNWTRSDQFIPSIKRWNDIASLCILTEPCAFQRIFHSLKYNPADVENRQSAAEEINQHINDYWHTSVEKLYRQIGMGQLEQIRRDLCFDAQMLDPNRWIHTLLCLGKSELRLELEGHLGGALLLRTMAEILRRATEEAFDTTLREEDELGKGWVPEGFKKTLYGSSRVLDDPQAGSIFVRQHGLNYKPRVHVYVEGTTEHGAFNHFFKMMGIFVPITNLHGLIKSDEGNQMLTFFRDSLQADIKDQVYSIVMIDGDLQENVKVVVGAARINQTSGNEGMFGRFFLARPDFELANFAIEELEEILWNWVVEHTETSPSQADRELLHSYVKDATGSTEFFAGVGHATRSLPQLTGYEKGEAWGAKLIDYAWEHPLKQYRKRQVIEAAELTIRWEKIIHMERYDVSQKSYMVDLGSGELIARPSHA